MSYSIEMADKGNEGPNQSMIKYLSMKPLNITE